MAGQTTTENQTTSPGKNAREGGVSTREGVLVRVREVLSVGVSETVLDRGMRLYAKEAAHASTTYPWVYWVSSHGPAYRVNLMVPECGCKGAWGSRVCKHIVCAGADFIDRWGA